MNEITDLLGYDTVAAVIAGDVRTRERRGAEIQWRVPGTPGAADAERVLIGYPAVFNEWTVLYEDARHVIRERIAPGFFDDVLNDDCHLLYVHDSATAMARNGLSGPGGMELSVDEHGLRVYARLPLDDFDVQRLAPKMGRGVIDQMSFAFSVAEEELDEHVGEDGRIYHDYTLIKCRRLYDVTICPLGAYPQTEAVLRSLLADSRRRSDEGAFEAERRSDEGAPGGSGRSDEGRDVEELKAEALERVRQQLKAIKEGD